MWYSQLGKPKYAVCNQFNHGLDSMDFFIQTKDITTAPFLKTHDNNSAGVAYSQF